MIPQQRFYRGKENMNHFGNRYYSHIKTRTAFAFLCFHFLVINFRRSIPPFTRRDQSQLLTPPFIRRNDLSGSKTPITVTSNQKIITRIQPPGSFLAPVM